MDGRAGWQLRPAAPAITAAVLGLVATLLVTFVPSLHFVYRSAPAHLALENLDASVAALVTVLFYGRYQRTQSMRDLLVGSAFALLAASGYMLVLVPAATNHPAVVWTSWVPLVVRLFAAGLVALAAANPRRTSAGTRHVPLVAATAGMVLLAVLIVGFAVGDQLPTPLDPAISPASSHRPVLVGDSAVLAAQATHALLYGFAAVAFAVDASRTRDELTEWLAAGCSFAAFARVNYFLFPSLYSQFLYTGDFLRTAFYLVLAYGALRELRTYWSLHAEAAVFAERRRIARDLHDGTIQELGYIRTLARQAGKSADGASDRIAAAAERALAEARQAIAALSLPLDEPLAEVLRRTAGEVGDRYDVEVQVDAGEVGRVDRDTREAIVRIVREAVSNAARHADARRIEVRVNAGWVEVRDDGRGFDPHRGGEGGYGLVSMRDRAEAVGGSLHVTSRSGSGTVVRMVWDGGRG